MTELHDILLTYGFRHARDEGSMRGYLHDDGRAAVVDDDGPWIVGSDKGNGAASLALALSTAPVPRHIGSSEAANARLAAALRSLRGDWTLEILRDSKTDYTAAMRFLKKLRGSTKITAKDCEPARVEAELAAMLGVPKGLRNGARVACMALKAKSFLAEYEKVERRRAKAEAIAIRRVGGAPKLLKKSSIKLSRKKDAAQRVALEAELKARIAAAARALPLAEPRADAEIRADFDAMKVVVNRDTGIELLVLERPNSQGAICVYNNGIRVAAGVVQRAAIESMRRSTVTAADAAKQLLYPDNGAEVTDVAKRHLTAVVGRSKDDDDMMDTKKFAAKGTAKSAKKTTEKPVKPAKAGAKPALKADGAARKSGLFRLRKETEKDWSAFSGQKGTIVAAFKKIGAVGAKAKGVTRAELIAALPNVPAANISFYLSRWQGPGIVEKLQAAA